MNLDWPPIDPRREARLIPLPPFRLDATARTLQRRPTNRVDLWADDAYWRVLDLDGVPRLVTARQLGSEEQSVVVIRVEGESVSPALVEAAAVAMGYILNVEADTAEFTALAEDDAALAPVARVLRGLKPPRFPSLWETFVNVVVFQQISLLAALAISGRTVERYGRRLTHDGRVYFAFPEPAAIADALPEDLRALGHSRRKVEVLQTLAREVGRGDELLAELRRLSSAEAIERLIRLPGIGRWSASVILLRGLGRLDVFPAGDSGFIRGLSEALGREGGLAKGEELDLAARYGPWQGMLYLLVVGYRLMRLGLLPASPL